VLLLDEPFAALDAQTRLLMYEWLGDLLASRPSTPVLVTHDVEEALLLGDRLVLLGARPATVMDELAVRFGPRRGRTVLSTRRSCGSRARCWTGCCPPDPGASGRAGEQRGESGPVDLAVGVAR